MADDIVSDDDAGAADATKGAATPGWWSRPSTSPTTAPSDGTDTPAPSGDPRWRWDLPTDSIKRRSAWASVRVALPLMFGLVLLVALLAGAVGAAIGITSERHNSNGFGNSSGPVVISTAAPVKQPAARSSQSLAGIAARTLPSVVEVDVSAGAAKDTGSGFVIATQGSSAYILTNNHVISLAATQHGNVRVVLQNGTSIPARIRGRATTSDLAVLQVARPHGVAPLTLGNSDGIAVGDPVIAVGSPLGFAGTVTAGIVSAEDRPVDANGEGTDTQAVIDAIQTDAAINPGNSGGPLVDAAGHVIGVTSAIATLSNGSSNPFGGQQQAGNIGLGFAIPINSARDTAQQIIHTGFAVRPVIGIALDPQYDGSPPGGLIGCSPQAGRCTPVSPNGPAAKAGLRSGDIIVSIDGRRTPGADEVVILTRKHRPGDTVRIEIVRDGEHKTLTLKLGQAKA
ncbi:MAG: S1C family serine protease [Actinomycetes bacterium]